MCDKNWSTDAAGRLLTNMFHMKKSPVNRQARELSVGETGLLNLLYRQQGPVTAGAVSRMMGIGSGGVTNLMNALEKKGLLLRQMSPTDRRSVNVSISDSGRALVREKQEDVLAITGNILEQMGKEDAEMLIALLERFMRLGDAIIKEKERNC